MSATEVHDGSREPASSNHELTAGSVKMVTVRNAGDTRSPPFRCFAVQGFLQGAAAL